MRSATRVRASIGLLAALAVPACAGPGLRSEREDPSRAAALAPLLAAPGEARVVEAVLRDGRRVGLAVESRGTGTRDRFVVLVHGVLSDRRTWRYVAADLLRDHDLLLVDLPGCGASDAPDPDLAGPGCYAPEALADAVLAALAARLDGVPARPLTFVGHSLGASVVLRALESPALAASHAALLSRVDSAVLLAPLDVAIEKSDPDFQRIASLPGGAVHVADALGVLRRETTRTVRRSAREGSTPPLEEVLRIEEVLGSTPRRRAAQAMIREACPFGPDGRPDWARGEALRDDHRRLRVPVLLVAGDRDDVLGNGYAYRLQATLPDAYLRIVRGGTHPLPTEDPAISAAAIRRFARERGARWARLGEFP